MRAFFFILQYPINISIPREDSKVGEGHTKGFVTSSHPEYTIKEAAQKDKEFKGAVESGDHEQMEQYVKEKIFNKPDDYFTMERVRQGYKADRHISLWEIMDIFG